MLPCSSADTRQDRSGRVEPCSNTSSYKMLGRSVQVSATWSLKPSDTVSTRSRTKMIRGPTRSTNNTVAACLREQCVPITGVCCRKAANIVGWVWSIESYGLTGEGRFVCSKFCLVDHVSDNLGNIVSIWIGAGFEVETPEAGIEHEFKLKSSRSAAG